MRSQAQHTPRERERDVDMCDTFVRDDDDKQTYRHTYRATVREQLMLSDGNDMRRSGIIINVLNAHKLDSSSTKNANL